jgi:hypothetical protein
MKDQKKPNAFPYSGVGDDMNYSRGMTLRDYFAARAMEGICNARSHSDLKGHAIASAKVAYELADAMMKAREA